MQLSSEVKIPSVKEIAKTNKQQQQKASKPPNPLCQGPSKRKHFYYE